MPDRDSDPDFTPCPFSSLTVIGLGLIGGSLALAAHERFPRLPIFVVDSNADTRQKSIESGLAEQAFESVESAMAILPQEWVNQTEAVASTHLVVLACHLSGNLDVLQHLARCCSNLPVLVTDIGSCKQAISELSQALLPTQFIPGHPMAGKAVSGFQSATASLFREKIYLLSPLPETPVEKLALLETFLSAIGAVPRRIDATEHDRVMAYVSHLPQVYAVLLAQLLAANQPDSLRNCFGAGLDDQLRLAASPFAMWGDILRYNRDNVRDALTGLRNLIDEALADDTAASWAERFNEANATEACFQEGKRNRKTNSGKLSKVEG